MWFWNSLSVTRGSKQTNKVYILLFTNWNSQLEYVSFQREREAIVKTFAVVLSWNLHLNTISVGTKLKGKLLASFSIYMLIHAPIINEF